jgi:hypothetical protein
MPQEVKQVFLETFKKFPDVTFLWKYEKDEHKIAEGYQNVVTDKWVPQNDLLGMYCTYKKPFFRFGNSIPVTIHFIGNLKEFFDEILGVTVFQYARFSANPKKSLKKLL